MNLNKLAKEITVMEGLKQSLSIAQVKEVIALLGIRWRKMIADKEEDRMDNEIDLIILRAGEESEHLERY